MDPTTFRKTKVLQCNTLVSKKKELLAGKLQLTMLGVRSMKGIAEPRVVYLVESANSDAKVVSCNQNSSLILGDSKVLSSFRLLC